MLHCEKTKRITLFKIIRNMIIQNNTFNIIFLSFKLHYVEKYYNGHTKLIMNIAIQMVSENTKFIMVTLN